MKYSLITYCSLSLCASAQITVNSTNNATTLTEEILGPRIDIVGTPILNGSSTSAGLFSEGNAAFTNGSSFDSGILLSTGNVNSIVGPNDSEETGTPLGQSGSQILDNILADTGSSLTTNDATSLSFQFSTTSTANLSFNYIFGSDEFNEFVGSDFNDVFAFLLTPDTDPTNGVHDAGETFNIAVLPDTQTGETVGPESGIISNGTIVSINTVNNDINSESFVNNDEDVEDQEGHELDGRTVSLEASFENLPEGIHEIQLIIGDTDDSFFDSVVLLESNTFFIIPNSPIPFVINNVQQAAIDTSFRDINSRLLRARAGYEAKSKALFQRNSTEFNNDIGNIHTSSPHIFSNKLRFFGAAQTYSSSIDAFATESVNVPEVDIDLYGGNVGLEYTLTENIKIGTGFIHNQGDVTIGRFDRLDAEYNAFSIYGALFQPLTESVHLHADALYGKTFGELSFFRDFEEFGITTGSGDSDIDHFEFNVGLNFHSNIVTHGPIFSYRNSQSSVDSIAESGFAASVSPAINTDIDRFRYGYQATAHNYTNTGNLSIQGRLLGETQRQDSDLVISGNSGSTNDTALVAGIGVIWSFETGGYLAADWEGRFSNDINANHFQISAGFNF